MPGLSFAFHNNVIDNEDKRFQLALKQTEYLDSFSSQVVFKNRHAILGVSRSFPEYPFVVFENDRFQIWMEGKIYNLRSKQISDAVLSLSEKLFANNLSPLVEWLSKTDGDFVLAINDKHSCRWAICRDLLGRLPIFYSQNEKCLVVSRDLRFVRKYIGASALDRISLGQLMQFGHLLGGRTFYQNVHKAEPSALFVVAPSQRAAVHSLKDFDYSNKQHRRLSAAENAGHLAKLFAETCSNRVDRTGRSILLLSGGYDSRAIAAALKIEGVDFTAFSWMRYDKKNQLDFTISEQVANLLRVPRETYPACKCTTDDVEITFLLKNGLDSLGFVYPMHVVRYLHQMYGSGVTLFNGLGGDQFMQDISPSMPLYTFRGLCDFVAAQYPLWRPKDIENLLGISQKESKNHIEERLLSYPEKSLKQKYVHWRIHEYQLRRFIESDDRAFNFYWSVTPLSGWLFYEYAMNCPDTQKSNRYLYTLMLKELVPDIINIPYAFNPSYVPEPIAQYADATFQRKARQKRLLRAIRKSPNPLRYLYKKVKNVRATSVPSSKPRQDVSSPASLVECVLRQAEIPQIAQYFSRTQLDHVVQNMYLYNEASLNYLFTVMTVIEDFHGVTPTINTYQNENWV